jgi:hypothetical protein
VSKVQLKKRGRENKAKTQKKYHVARYYNDEGYAPPEKRTASSWQLAAGRQSVLLEFTPLFFEAQRHGSQVK